MSSASSAEDEGASSEGCGSAFVIDKGRGGLTLITTGHPAAMAFTRGEMAHNQGKF